MSLIKLYQSVNPVTLVSPEAIVGSITPASWYHARHDCVIMQTYSAVYKLYRDGTAIRLCQRVGPYLDVFNIDTDLIMKNELGGTTWVYCDPIGFQQDETKIAPPTYSGLATSAYHSVVWNGHHYGVSGSNINKRDMAGTIVTTYTTTGVGSGVFTHSPDFVDITPDGIAVTVDASNGAGRGTVRFFDLYNNVTLYESTFDPGLAAWVDRVNRNIWTIDATTYALKVWSFHVAPSNFTSITMGSNRSRYRQDDLSVTLRGSDNEPVPYWPVKWTLTTGEGHLRDEVTETGVNGVTTNLYCGPGATDYVGNNQTIQVETGY